MIINTGTRTDIPAFYSKWFINRIREGYVLVRNPYNPQQVTKYLLNPNIVDSIEFCTKNPEPILKYIDEFSHFNQFWFVTITSYAKDIEPNVPPKSEVISSFQELSNKIGNNCVGWRYDPIFLTDKYDINYHITNFERIAKKLSGYTETCIISFIDLYEKVKTNAGNLKAPSIEEELILASAFVEIGNRYNIKIKSCCEGTHLKVVGVDISGCRNKDTIEKSLGYYINPPKVKNIRKECDCLMGNDIGAYDSCQHFCKYCYANSSNQNVEITVQSHDVSSPLLIGNLADGDYVTVSKQQLWKIKNKQISLFE